MLPAYTIKTVSLLAAVAGFGLLTVGVSAQIDPYSSGLMLGSTINDRINPRDHNRDHGRWPAPQPGYTGGVNFIPGSGYYYGGRQVIIVNNAPCYIPDYYGGFGGYGYGSYSSGG